MKKLTSTLLSLTLILTLLLSLAGCGSSETDKFVGTWTASVDTAELMNGIFEETDEEMAEYLHLDDCAIDLVFTFTEQGAYSSQIDADAFNAWYDKVIADLSAGLNNYLEAMAHAQGLDMTAEEMLAMSGMDMAALLEGAIDQDTLEEALQETETGSFEVKDGKLTTKLDEDTSITYTYEFVSDTELVLSDPEGDEEAVENSEFMFPLTLKKQ